MLEARPLCTIPLHSPARHSLGSQPVAARRGPPISGHTPILENLLPEGTALDATAAAAKVSTGHARGPAPIVKAVLDGVVAACEEQLRWAPKIARYKLY